MPFTAHLNTYQTEIPTQQRSTSLALSEVNHIRMSETGWSHVGLWEPSCGLTTTDMKTGKALSSSIHQRASCWEGYGWWGAWDTEWPLLNLCHFSFEEERLLILREMDLWVTSRIKKPILCLSWTHHLSPAIWKKLPKLFSISKLLFPSSLLHMPPGWSEHSMDHALPFQTLPPPLPTPPTPSPAFPPRFPAEQCSFASYSFDIYWMHPKCHSVVTGDERDRQPSRCSWSGGRNRRDRLPALCVRSERGNHLVLPISLAPSPTTFTLYSCHNRWLIVSNITFSSMTSHHISSSFLSQEWVLSTSLQQGVSQPSIEEVLHFSYWTRYWR